MNKFIGFFYVILAGIGFGFLGIFGRLAFQSGFSVGELLTWRFTFAAIILWVYLLIFNKKLIKLTTRQILISVSLGSFGYSVFSTLYFISIQGISISLAAMLLFTFPLFVNLVSHFFLKERMNSKQFISLTLATLGLVILLWGPLFVNSIYSVICGLLAALAYSLYVIISGRYQKGVEPISSSLYVITAAAITLYLFHQPSYTRLLHFTQTEICIIVGLATVCTLAPLTLFLAGLQRLNSSTASIVVMIEPVVAALAAWLILNETMNTNQLIGSIVVVFALTLNIKS